LRLTLIDNESSTVSKILRQKDKYMNPPPKEEVTSPGKKSKAKLPDFEKTLTNWVKNQQRKGLPVTDEELRKQARMFSFSRSDQALLSSPSWLEKFKQKNNLGHHSSSNASDNVDSSTTSLSETPINASPASSNGLVSPPMSAIDENGPESASKTGHDDDYFDFDDQGYSGSPVTSADLEHSLSGPVLSPLSPSMLRSDELPELAMDDDFAVATLPNSRQRSQTLPYVSGHESRPSSSSKKQPSLPGRSMTTSLPSSNRPTSMDPRQMMKRHKSVPDIHDNESVRYSSMQPPPLPRSADISPVSMPSSPFEDDNIKALHEIKKILQQHPGVADADDYLAIGKLMEKLKLLRSPTQTPALPGGMHPLELLDSPRMSKKRTIMGISN
jgi:hypothetical protein